MDVLLRLAQFHGMDVRIDPTTSEALALFHALNFYKESGLSCIILEGDA